MSGIRTKAFTSPNEVATFDHGTSVEVHLGELTVGRQVLQPGWRWSRDVKPLVGTTSCRFHHTGVVLSGWGHVQLDDGTEADYGPDTVYDIPPGHDGWVVGDEPLVLIEWSGVHRWASPVTGDRALATVLFTDIVDSTATAERMGDAQWAVLLERHNTTMRGVLDRYRGQEVNTTGDGMLATFDGPARAVSCAVAMHQAVASLGLAIRIGIHTGEVEVVPGGVRGVAVHVAARIMALAQPGETLVSATTRDLASGGEFAFVDRGAHSLKGVTGDRAVFAVS